MPKSVIKRANEILSELEQNNRDGGASKDISRNLEKISEKREGFQVSLFEFNDPLLMDIKKQIEGLDVNNTTPVEALNKLAKIKSLLTGKKI
jgi:DNA mismatch repair protein MutS